MTDVEIVVGRGWLESRGFGGFISVASLRELDLEQVSARAGVYAVVRETDEEIRFLSQSIAGHFKGRDPTVRVDQLQTAWVPSSQVLYLGKAGTALGGQSIRKRVKQLLDFGAGRPVGHWGGRYLWQIESSGQLLVSWRETPQQDPSDVEKGPLEEHVAATGHRPFANRVGGRKRAS